MRIKNKTEKGLLAIGQIVLLVAGLFAVASIINDVHVVSAQGEQCIRSSTDGKTYKVSEINDIVGWCSAHGGDDKDPTRACDYSPHKLRTEKMFDCSSAKSSVPSIPVPAPAISLPSPTIPGTGSTNPIEGASEERLDDVLPGRGSGLSFSIGTILGNAAWSAAIYLGMRFVLGQLGASPEFTSSASLAVAGGYFIGKTLLDTGLATKLGGLLGISGGLAATGVGIIAAGIIFFATFKKTKYEVVSYSCFPWDAPLGGQHCGECNNKDFPCTEYRCRALGQACELINQGTNEELCVWMNQGDVNPPVIQPWEETLTPDYNYIPDTAISPPDRGVKIVRDGAGGANDCVAPFTALRFGVTLDEPGKCKIDPLNERNFDDMRFFFGGSSTSKFNHSQTMSLPSPEALEAENITLQNGIDFTLYARCEDANGNSNVANFVFNFCVDEAQDTTAPLIRETSIINGNPIAFNQTSTNLDIFVNEPAECRWSKTDQSYDNMENQMTCNTNVLEFNGQGLYECSTILTGLKDRQDNDFYFRCEDQPHLRGTGQESQRNKNAESFRFTLAGTRPLVISSLEPNGTIKDSTDPIKVTLEVETIAGHNEGQAICEFSDTGEVGDFVEFFETDSHQHSQDLFLAEGDYTYHIQCVDLGGNVDTATTSFTVETDTTAPSVIRVFHEENRLKVRTNEEASCVYDNFVCDYLFEDGIPMNTLDDKEHSTTWDPDKSFYLKCEDEFGNRPNPNQCSLIVKPFEA